MCIRDRGYTQNLHTHGFNFDEKVLLRGLQVYMNILTKAGEYTL